MNKRNTFVLAILAAAGIVSLPINTALAVPTTQSLADEGGMMGEVSIGGGVLSHDSERLGRFTGIDTSGFFSDISATLLSRSSYMDEEPYQWRLEAQNLGLDSRSVMLSGGSQGRYSSFVYYREMPNLIHHDVGTPYSGVGSRNLTLPAGGGVGSIEQNLREVDIETKRTRMGLGGRMNLTPQWRVSTALHREHKEGSKVRGIGDHWGLQSATLVPAPVDHDTTRFEADVTYDSEKLQTRLGYMLSRFKQGNGTLLRVADAHAGGWSDAPVRIDSLEPRNEFHQFSGNVGYSLNAVTRFGADVMIGKMQQDHQFINDGSLVLDAAGNPTNSLDGEIDTKVINLRASTRVDRVSLRANFRTDDRDNKTPELIVDAGPLQNYTVGFQCGVAAGVTASQCITRPISYKQTRLNTEAEWQMIDRTYLTVAYTNDERERTYEDRDTTKEKVYEARLRSRLTSGTTVGANLSKAEQRGSNWERETLPVQIRKYYLADRDRTSVGIHVSATPIERVQASVRGQWINDEYIASELGLTSAARQMYTADLAWVPTDRLQTYAFYSYEVRSAEQAGFGDGVAWSADRDDHNSTLGVGGEYALIPKLLTIGAEGVVVQTLGKINVATAGGVGGAYPDLKSSLGMFSVYGDWAYSERFNVRVRYMLERYEERDWAVDDYGVRGVGDLILLERSSPDYVAHLIAATVRYRF